MIWEDLRKGKEMELSWLQPTVNLVMPMSKQETTFSCLVPLQRKFGNTFYDSFRLHDQEEAKTWRPSVPNTSEREGVYLLLKCGKEIRKCLRKMPRTCLLNSMGKENCRCNSITKISMDPCMEGHSSLLEVEGGKMLPSFPVMVPSAPQETRISSTTLAKHYSTSLHEISEKIRISIHVEWIMCLRERENLVPLLAECGSIEGVQVTWKSIFFQFKSLSKIRYAMQTCSQIKFYAGAKWGAR